ncbi:MAG TPA: PAS domain-containing sensor histidine kinase, partial [Ktedonobacteraceae bacterium]|nr:PAS domain-containing sensor histidine kinase [Ktedonobacteraceae bacterium]
MRSEEGEQVKGGQWQIAVQAAHIGVWDWNVQDNQITWDDQCKELFVFYDAKDTLDYESFLSLLHPEDRERMNILVQRTVNKQDENYASDYCVIWSDGSIHWLAVQGKGFYDQQGRLIHMKGAMFDVTERKNVEAALRASEAKFRRLVDANIIGMVIASRDGNILEANAAFLSLVGYTQEDLATGCFQWWDLITAESAGQAEMLMHELLSKEMVTAFETEILTKGGRRVPVLMAGALLEQSSDTFIGFILDMTAQKDADKQKDIFISMVSHELRSPLTSIKGNIELAQRHFKRLIQTVEAFSSGEKRAIDKVELLLERALHYAGVQDRFINDLLDASRMDVHKLELLLSLYDLKAIVQETIKDFHCTIPSRTIFFECPEHDQILVMADADRISQVITNYITNAFKYSAASEPVIVRLTRERTEAKVCVRDFGPGLTVEEQEKIWCRFYQVPSIRVQSSHGA